MRKKVLVNVDKLNLFIGVLESDRKFDGHNELYKKIEFGCADYGDTQCLCPNGLRYVLKELGLIH